MTPDDILLGVYITFHNCRYEFILGSATFIISAYLSHEWSTQSTRQNVQSHMVMGWAARLGLFLFTRIMKDGEDKRFVVAKQKPSVFFKFWIIQGKKKCIFFQIQIIIIFIYITPNNRIDLILLKVFGCLLRCFQL